MYVFHLLTIQTTECITVCPGDEWPKLQSGLLRLYTMRFCPYSHRVRLVLEYKTIPLVASVEFSPYFIV